MHVAYKHLESRLRIGELTIAQWAGLLAGVGVAIGWGLYLSPLGAYASLVSAIYLGGIPAAAAFLASVSEFDLVLLVRSAIRWRRTAGRYLPGPGGQMVGYVLTANERDSGVDRGHGADLDLTALWEC